MKILNNILSKKILTNIKLDKIIETGNSLLDGEKAYLFFKGEEVGCTDKVTIDFVNKDDIYTSILKLLSDVSLCIEIDKNDFYDKDNMNVDEIKIFEMDNAYNLLYDKKLRKNHIMNADCFKKEHGIKHGMIVRFKLKLD